MYKCKCALFALIGSILFSTVNVTYALPTDDTDTVVITEIDEKIDEDVYLEEQTDNVALDNLESEFDGEEAEYDGYESISVTTHDEINTVQLSLYCKMPKYFTLGVKMNILNLDTDEMYEIVATKANNYYGKLYVPAGSYTVASVMVDGDITDKYPMEYPKDFTVYDDSNHSIETTLVNYDEIQLEAYERMGLDENGNPITEEKDTYNETVYEETIVTEDNQILPWRIVEHSGTGNGVVTISGIANGIYDIAIEITTTGEGKEAEYRYTTDGGVTWSSVRIVSSTEIVTTDGSSVNTGLKFNFDSNDMYVKGDKYTYKSAYEYEAEVENTINGDGTVRIYSDEPLYNATHQIRVTITQTGNIEDAVFNYNLNGTITENIKIPEDGIFNIPNTPIKVRFWDAGGKFVVGDAWYSKIEGIAGERDFTPYYIGAGVIVAFVVFLFFYYFALQKEKVTDYKLMPYKRVVVPEQTKKPNKKEKRPSKKKNKNDNASENTDSKEGEA